MLSRFNIRYFLRYLGKKSTGVVTLSMAEFHHAEHQDPGNGSQRWNAAIITVLSYTCPFPAVN